MKKILFILLLLGCQKNKVIIPVLTETNTTGYYKPEKFVMGGDLSYINQIEDSGGLFRDSMRVKEPFKLLKDRGMNCVRVRLWHTPSWSAKLNNKGLIYSGLDDVTKTIRRAKAQGMVVNLDVHYSDIWADPHTQKLPKAWEKLDFETLKDSVYQYTFSVLKYLEAQNLTPEMIQIGNENNPGMLFPHGEVKNNNWKPFCALLQSGINAVRDFSKTAIIKPKIILHVAQFHDATWWAEGVITKGGITDFDILGISHYYKWGTINNFKAIENIIKTLKIKYLKEIMVVETAFSWSNTGADQYNNIMSSAVAIEGYDISPAGQKRYMIDFTQAIISAGGTGIMYWEPAWITSPMRDLWGTGSSWENNALFDFEGNTLPAMDFMTEQYRF